MPLGATIHEQKIHEGKRMSSLKPLYHENNTRTPLGLVVFIHECKSPFLRDPSDYKIFLYECTLTHAIDNHYILQDNDISYVEES